MTRYHDEGSRSGTVYLLHFHPPGHPDMAARYKHAAHYLGFSSLPIEERLQRHRDGRGARLLQVILTHGLDFSLVRTWEGGQDLERRLKAQHSPELCPVCRKLRKSARLEGKVSA